ncbi:MAG TPA: methylenetetrahydrofolate reductase, partial [Promineifilum sp.]|nr:methylenetetrahydrofolate reductase [Promineifilum sp.]
MDIGADQLAGLAPEFFSVTYGAGGVTRDKTLGVVDEIASEGHPVAPHLSCVGASREGVAELLAHWRARGVRRLVALRGDLPSGMVDGGEFRHASDLVAFVRERTGDWFRIEVAAYPEMHPQAATPDADLAALHGADAQALPIVPAGDASRARLAALSASEPAGLVAHAYVRYMGDLSRGQLLREIVARSLAR